MRSILRNLKGAFVRVFPNATNQSQAVAFNLFLTFFPILLLVLGLLTSTRFFGGAIEEIHARLLAVLPPGSKRLVADYLIHQGASTLKWSTLGLLGSVIIGTQVMVGLLQGVQLVHRVQTLGGYWKQQLRAFFLLMLTVVPWTVAVAFTVFGGQVRGWMILHFGLPTLFNGLWLVVYVGLVLVLAVLLLAVIYRAGRPGCRGWNEVLPGAVVATLLWWAVNTAFGYYVRKVPYGPVYGGLAAVIGLLVWMNLSTLVVFLGAAYNAEALPVAPKRRASDRPPSARQGPEVVPPATAAEDAETPAPQAKS